MGWGLCTPVTGPPSGFCGPPVLHMIFYSCIVLYVHTLRQLYKYLPSWGSMRVIIIRQEKKEKKKRTGMHLCQVRKQIYLPGGRVSYSRVGRYSLLHGVAWMSGYADGICCTLGTFAQESKHTYITVEVVTRVQVEQST